MRWLHGTPSPDTPPYGPLPNMSESSGAPGESPGFSRFIVRGELPIANAFLVEAQRRPAILVRVPVRGR